MLRFHKDEMWVVNMSNKERGVLVSPQQPQFVSNFAANVNESRDSLESLDSLLEKLPSTLKLFHPQILYVRVGMRGSNFLRCLRSNFPRGTSSAAEAFMMGKMKVIMLIFVTVMIGLMKWLTIFCPLSVPQCVLWVGSLK